MEEVARILPILFRKYVRGAQPQWVDILRLLWPQVAGKAIAEHAWPIGFTAGTLTLGTPCPTWARQLREMREELRAEINAFLGASVVKKLRILWRPDFNQHPLNPRNPQLAIQDGVESPTSDFEGRKLLDPETARILEQSYAKYFARNGRTVS